MVPSRMPGEALVRVRAAATVLQQPFVWGACPVFGGRSLSNAPTLKYPSPLSISKSLILSLPAIALNFLRDRYSLFQGNEY